MKKRTSGAQHQICKEENKQLENRSVELIQSDQQQNRKKKESERPLVLTFDENHYATQSMSLLSSK